MDAMRSSWTDERLDDLNARVGAGFERVDRQFERVDRQFEELRAEMNSRFDAVDRNFAALNRTLIQCASGVAASMVLLVIAFVLSGH